MNENLEQMINAETQETQEAREKIENLLSEQVVDAAIEVHRTLGGPVNGCNSLASPRLSPSLR